MTREFCRDCICLVEGDNGEWICDETQKEISTMDYCPETRELCCNCCCLGDNGKDYYCNNGDSDKYNQVVEDEDSCNCFGYE